MQDVKGQRSNGGLVAAVLLLAACAVAFLLTGCEGNKKAALSEAEIERLTFAQKPDRPDTLIVSGEEITCDMITDSPAEDASSETSLRQQLEEFARNAPQDVFLQWARPRVKRRLNNEITNVVLYKRAQRELGEKADEALDRMAERELRRFILEHGSNNAEADAALQAMGRNRTTFKEWKKKQILAQYAVTSQLSQSRPITHGELLECYERMKAESFYQPGLLQFRLIDIQITQVELSDPNDDPIQTALALAEELLQKIKAGEDFAALAEKYSHGHRSAFGGLWKPRDPEALAAPYDVLARKAAAMEPGEVAGPIEADDHVFVMKLEQRQTEGYQPLREVQDKVAEQIITERRQAALKRLDTELVQQTALANTDQFMDHCLESLYRQVNASSDK